MTYQPKVHKDQGGDRLVVGSGGTLLVEEGGTLQFGANGPALNSSGAGTANTAAGVTAVESGDGIVHKTVLSLADAQVDVVATGAAVGFGGLKLYDFPAGRILVLGVTVDVDLAVPTASQADFTDATPEGDLGLGTAITANASLGDATDVDLCPSTGFTMDAYAASVGAALAASAQFDGTTTAIDACLNVLVDAADIDNDTTGEILCTGTVTLHWINLGDY